MDRTTIHQEKVGWNGSSCQMCGVLSILASCGRKRHGAEQLSSCISRQSGDDRGDCQIVGPQGGVANTVVFLKNISSGKAINLPEPRRFLDQKHCRYEPHILLVAQDAELRIKSSDATLHTVHMDGAATYNLPFPFTNQIVSRTMPTAGLANVRCNGGHAWMNAEILVVSHPYYTVTDESGKFQLTGVPPGEYEIVAWHEGWKVLRQEAAFDVLTERRIQRPVFSEPKTWEKKVTVGENNTTAVNFVL